MNESPTLLQLIEKLSVLEDRAVQKVLYETIASNDISETELSNLSRSSSTVVRSAVARNVNSSEQILEMLSQDEENTVKINVANNDNVSSHVLTILSNDPALPVKIEVARNWSTPPEVLEKLFKNTPGLNKAFAQNVNTPVEILNKLSKNESVVIREAVAENSSTSVTTVFELAFDKVQSVREKAVNNPNYDFELYLKEFTMDETSAIISGSE